MENKEIEQLLKEYKDKIVIPKKNYKKIIDYIKNNFGTIEITEDYDYKRIIGLAKKNCESLIEFNKLGIKDIDIKAFNIIEDDSSYKYYSKEQDLYEGYIHVFIETNTGYIFSNSTELYIDLFLFSGLNHKDIEFKSPELIMYLNFLNEKYKKHLK